MTTAPNFDRLARPYRWLEYLTFGPFLHRTRLHFLPTLATLLPAHAYSPTRALILGDGDGRFTARLLATLPHLHAHAIDISPAMLDRLRHAAAPHSSRLTTTCADLRTCAPFIPSVGMSGVANPPTDTPTPYSLITTHFFLDCLTTDEVSQLVHRLTPQSIPASAQPGTLWLISEFATPPTLFGRLIARPIVHTLYLAFRLLTHLPTRTLPDYPTALRTNGWQLLHQKSHLSGLLLSQLWHLPPPNQP